MKKLLILMTVTMLLWGCKPKSDTEDMYFYDLMIPAHPTVLLYEGNNSFNISDFFSETTCVDSVTYSNPECIMVSGDKTSINLDCKFETMPYLSEMSFWVDGHHYSVLCKKAPVVRTAFTMDDDSNVNYNNVILNGNFGSRYSDSVMMSFEGNHWATNLYLESGNYRYRFSGSERTSGDTKATGEYQTITVADSFKNAATIHLKKYSKNNITITASQEIDEYFIFWQGYRIPNKISNLEAMDYIFEIPAAAAKMPVSFISISAFNQQGITNDLLIPLINGNVANKETAISAGLNLSLLCLSEKDTSDVPILLVVQQLFDETGLNAVYFQNQDSPEFCNTKSSTNIYHQNHKIYVENADNSNNLYQQILGNYGNELVCDQQLNDISYLCFSDDSISFDVLASGLNKTFRSYGYQHRLVNMLPEPSAWPAASNSSDFNDYLKLMQIVVFRMTIPGIPALHFDVKQITDNNGNIPNNISKAVGIDLNLINEMRKQNPALQFGDFKIIEASASSFAFQRSYFDNIVVVAFNKSDSQKIVALNLMDVPAETQFVEYFGKIIKQSNDYVKLDIAPHSFSIIISNR